ncbi:MAG: HAMP domain-containing histidine kinase [Bacteroidales bacterium]|nr:HAMP domain-containing histidine kinase [Bacteroidales bacterium]
MYKKMTELTYEELLKQIKEYKRKLREKSLEAEKLKSNFLANISHELRTPLNSIVGFANLLNDSQLNNDEMKTYIREINRGSESFLKVVENIIQQADIETKRVEMLEEECSVDNILDDLFSSYSDTLKKNSNLGPELRLNNKIKKKIKIFTDPKKLKYILSNLIDNAIKFTSDGYVEFGYMIENDDTIKFFVSDTGIGIPKDKLNVIFEKFRQVEEGMTRQYGGLGIGLTTCNNYVEMFGGEMNVESIYGVGSNFSFTIPMRQSVLKIPCKYIDKLACSMS